MSGGGRVSYLPNFLSAPEGEQHKQAARAATRTRLQGESMALVPGENKRSRRSIHRYNCMFRTQCADAPGGTKGGGVRVDEQ